ncbi:MAG: 2-hydroxyacid dehydrogenase [Acidimicrobiales bacterium]
MADPHVLVTFRPSRVVRGALDQAFHGVAGVTYLADVEAATRREAIGSADAVLAWNLGRELEDPGELTQLGAARLVQLLSAGVDEVPLNRIPADVPVASNAGAYAGPMAEHVLAMALALAKHLPQRHAALESGIFDQSANREIRGAVVCVLGFGGIGRASARLFEALGARIRAVTRSPVEEQWVEWAGPVDDLETGLSGADIVVVSLPLTRATRGLVGARELSFMKPDAILINVARGPIIDEDALYRHLGEHPAFQAGLDVWWDEPRSGEPFAPRLPFLHLPNVLGSPHNSGITETSLAEAARRAAANVVRVLDGSPPEHLVDRREYGD